MINLPQIQDVVLFLVVGAFMGWGASLLAKGSSSGAGKEILCGMTGALLTGVLAHQFYASVYGIKMAIEISAWGAVALLLILRLLKPLPKAF